MPIDDHQGALRPPRSPTYFIDVIGDRRLWRGPAPWVLLLLVAANVWVATNNADLVKQRQENLRATRVVDTSAGPLASQRVRLYPDRGDSPPRFDESAGEATWTYWNAIPDAAATNLVVLMGMSQNFAINDYHPGELTIAENVDDLVRASGARAFGLFAPNLANEELELLVLALIQSPRTLPRVLIFGACFDKFRNVDVRPGLQKFLRNTPQLEDDWKQAIGQFSERYPLATAKMGALLKTIDEDGHKTDDASVEGKLRSWVGTFSPLVAARSELNVRIQSIAYVTRNAALNIKTSSKRPVLVARYDLNRELLAMVVEQARAAGIRVGIYVVPLNPTADNPYVPTEYAAFKRWLENFSSERGITFTNLENAVPHEHWGEWMGGPDFKHFRAEGHRLTARAVVNAFGSLWTGPRTLKAP